MSWWRRLISPVMFVWWGHILADDPSWWLWSFVVFMVVLDATAEWSISNAKDKHEAKR